MAGLKELCKSTVNPAEHATQLIMTLQRIQIDASRLQYMAESGEYDVATVLECKRDIQRDLEMVNARLVFTCNDLENQARGVPVLANDEDAFGG